MELTNKLIGYDFEVFKYNWLVVLMDFDTDEKTVIIDDISALRHFYEEHKTDLWIGYNCREYDQYVLKGLLLGFNAWGINDQIINQHERGWRVVRDNGEYPLYTFDVMTDKTRSLKQLEGFMGSTIKESDVPFDLDRPLTEEEIEQTVYYCSHDVAETKKVFLARQEEFDAQRMIIEQFELPMSYFNKTKAQLVALVLDAERGQMYNDEFKLSFPDTLVLGEKYQPVLDWYKNPRNMDYKKSLIIEVAGVPHVFAWGGLHGAIPNYFGDGILLHLDVASLYPSLMIRYGYMSRNVKDSEKFKEIRDRRIDLKMKEDPRQLPLKILINSAYGTLKDKNNPMYDPLQANNVCVAGQLLILDLIEKMEDFCRIIQSNTDGIIIEVESEDAATQVRAIAAEWETRTGLNLKWDCISKICQKDVNNYIVLFENGEIESKGAYVKPLSNIDYDLPIVNKALTAKLLYGTPIDDIIFPCDDLREFQKIVKISGLYKTALHGDKPLKEKVLRVFASTNEHDPAVFKVKSEDKIEKIANTPDHCFIYNDNTLGVSCPPEIDKAYYVAVAEKRYADFIEPKKNSLKSSMKSEIKFVSYEAMQYLSEACEGEYPFIGWERFSDFAIESTEEKKLTKRQLKILAALSYFSHYGSEPAILAAIEILDELKWGRAKLIRNPSERLRAAMMNCDVTPNGNGVYKLTPETITQVIHFAEDNCVLELTEGFTWVDRIANQMELAGQILPTYSEADRPLLYVAKVRELARRKDGVQFGYAVETISIGSGKPSEFTIFNRTAKGKIPKVGDVLYCEKWDYDGTYYTMQKYRKVVD